MVWASVGVCGHTMGHTHVALERRTTRGTSALTTRESRFCTMTEFPPVSALGAAIARLHPTSGRRQRCRLVDVVFANIDPEVATR